MSNFNVRVLENVTDLLNKSVTEKLLFDDLKNEIRWFDDITHLGGTIPRLFALQATIEDGKIPLYRHPLDNPPTVVQFTPTVDKIRKILESKLNIILNHAIIQLYRNGEDFISEHSDKTLDICPNSLIVGYSVGETRIMKFRSKDSIGFRTKSDIGSHMRADMNEPIYDIHDIELNNDSAMILDLHTNRYYRHSIRSNASIVKPRISITFRTIGTFIKNGVIEGQGVSDNIESHLTKDELIVQYSKENNSSKYRWEDLYSMGYMNFN